MTTKAQLELFATERFPLHCSQIPELMACPWKAIMKFIEQNPRTSGKAADTGSAMHKAASRWHKNGKEEREALAAMRKAREEYPMADLIEAERLFLAYAQDPRNQDAKVLQAEFLLQGEIEEGIYLEGTTDQIRETAQGWEVWDVKTSTLPGGRVRDEYTYQLCAYAVLATQRFKRPVRPGGVIMPRGYPNEAKVFYPYDISAEQAMRLMAHVCNRVREVRAGRVAPIPGDHCGYCIGVRACLTKHDTYREEGRL